MGKAFEEVGAQRDGDEGPKVYELLCKAACKLKVASPVGLAGGGEMTAVIDTHVLLWWLSSPASLSPAVRKYFETWEIGTGQALICGVSLWELEDKRVRGKLALQFPVESWLPEIAAIPWMRLLETTPATWLGAAGLSWDHRDQADRIIAATGLGHGAPVLTKDRRRRGRFQTDSCRKTCRENSFTEAWTCAWLPSSTPNSGSPKNVVS